jgi:hypothetical protein
MKKRAVRVNLRLYPGQGRDDELIAWLAQFDGHGVKSQAVKEALLRGVGAADVSAQPSAALDPAELQEALKGAISSALDLGSLRQVVEAAVESALARFGGQIGGAAVADEEDDETEAILDRLGAGLVLADEGE